MGNEAYNLNSTVDGGASNETSPVIWQRIFEQARAIITSPKSAFEQIKSENKSISEIFTNYLLVLAALPPLASLIGLWLFGYTPEYSPITYRPPFFSGVIAAGFCYLGALVAVYLSASILEKLAAYFSATADLENSFRLVAYASTPIFVGSLLSFIPGLSAFGLIAGIAYTAYLVWLVNSEFVIVPKNNKPGYAGASAAVVFLGTIILFKLITYISPAPINVLSFPSIPDYKKIDLMELREGLKKLENELPKP